MMKIKYRDGNTERVRLEVEVSEKAIYRKELMTEEYVLLTFNTDELVNLQKGDYIDTDFGRFTIVTLDKPKRNVDSNGGWSYEQKFAAPWMRWATRKLFYARQRGAEKAWSMTQRPEYFMQIVIDNLLAAGFGEFAAQIDPELTEMKLVQFDGDDIVSGLNKIAEAWETEWWVTDNIIHLSKCEYGTPVGFKEGDLIRSMTRSDGQENDYITRLYAFGSTRNIPTNYRKSEDEEAVIESVVERRLKLPEGIDHLDAWPNLRDEDVVEGVAIFDEVYPRRTGKCEDITTEVYRDEVTDDEHPDGELVEWNAYRFKDSGIKFKSEYILPDTEELRITFQSGKLAGMDFAVVFNPDGEDESSDKAQVWEVVRNDTYGIDLPSDKFHPEEGDEYILYGYDTKMVSDILIPRAEQELLEKAQKLLAKTSIDSSVYTCETDKIRCAGYTERKGELTYNPMNEIDLDVGQSIELRSDNYFGDTDGHRISRVRAFEKRLDNKYNCIYEVGNTAAYSHSQELENKMAELAMLANRGVTVTGTGVALIRLNDTTAPNDHAAYSALRSRREFLSKTQSDSTPFNLTSKKLLTGEGGVQASARFMPGFIGHGAKTYTDEYGHTIVEADILRAREAMEAPEFRFNRIDVISGEQWQTFAFGTVKSVNPSSLFAGSLTIDLLDGELTTFKPGDIIRGLFHGLRQDGLPDQANAPTDSPTDSCGFPVYSGFSTSYLTPTDLIDADGNTTDNPVLAVGFRYSLRPGSSHPRQGMKLAAYGSFTDPSRRSTVWANRQRLIMMENVDTWSIDPSRHFTYIRGLLDGITIGDRVLQGHGVMCGRMYLYNPLISFSRDFRDSLKGADAYSVHLSRPVGVLRIHPDGSHEPLRQTHWLTTITDYEASAGLTLGGDGSPDSPTDGNDLLRPADNPIHPTAKALTAEAYILSTAIIVHREGNRLAWTATTPAKGSFTASIAPSGCTAELQAGIIVVTSIADTSAPPSVTVRVNCEGEAVIERVYSVAFVNDGEAGTWTSFVFAQGSLSIDSDTQTPFYLAPPKPDCTSPYPWKLTDKTDPTGQNRKWLDAPTAQGIWFMSKASVSGITGLVTGDGWSDPVKCTGEDGLDYDFMYAVSETTPGINRDLRDPNEGIYPHIWFDDPQTPGDNQALWMTTARIKQDGSTATFDKPDGNSFVKTGSLVGQWSEPVRISGEKGSDGKSNLRLDLDNEYDTILINKEGQWVLPKEYSPTSAVHLFLGTENIRMADLQVVSVNRQPVSETTGANALEGERTYVGDGFTLQVYADMGGDLLEGFISISEGANPAALPERLEIRLMAVAADEHGNPDSDMTAYAEWTIVRDEGECIYRLLPGCPQVVIDYDEDDNPYYVPALGFKESEHFLPCDIQRIDRSGATMVAYEMLNDIKLNYEIVFAYGGTNGGVASYSGAMLGGAVDEDITLVTFELYDATNNKLLDREGVPFLRNGKRGKRGLPGCMVRRWKSVIHGQEFRNDAELDSNGNETSGYVDFLMFRTAPSGDNNSGWTILQCTKTYVYNGNTIPSLAADSASEAASLIGENWNSAAAKSEHWREVDINVASGFFNFLIANHADIDILSGSQFLIRDDANNVVGGLQGAYNDRPIFWAGSESKDMATAPVRIYGDGRAYLSGELVSGDENGQRIHISPDSKSVNIYDAEGVRRTTLTGDRITSPSDAVNGTEISPSSGGSLYNGQSLTAVDEWVTILNTGTFNADGAITFTIRLSGYATLTAGKPSIRPAAVGGETVIGDEPFLQASSVTVEAEVWEQHSDWTERRVDRKWIWGATHDGSSGLMTENYYPDGDKEINVNCIAGCIYYVRVIAKGNPESISLNAAASFTAENKSYAAIFGSNGIMLRKGTDSFAVMAAAEQTDGWGNTTGESKLQELRNGIRQPYTIAMVEIDYDNREFYDALGSTSNIDWKLETGSMSFYIPSQFADSHLFYHWTLLGSSYGTSQEEIEGKYVYVYRKDGNYIQPILKHGSSFCGGRIQFEIKTI